MMKKKIFGVMFLFGCFVLNAKEKKSIFFDVVPKTLANYDYVVLNPLFVDEVYVTDLNVLKGKVFKKYSREFYYEEDGAGGLKMSEPGTPVLNYSYLFFDENGRAKKKVMVTMFENNNYCWIETLDYKYSNNKIQQKNKNREFNKGKLPEIKTQAFDVTYWFEKDGDKVLIKNSFGGIEQCHLNKDTDVLFMISSQDNKTNVNGYSNDSRVLQRFENNQLTRSDVFRWQAVFETRVFGPKGYAAEKHDGWDGVIPVYYVEYENDVVVKQFQKNTYLERRFNEAGFLEYEEERPKTENTAGGYYYYTAELLDEADETCLKFIKQVETK